MEGKIDIHKTEKRYDLAMAGLNADQEIHPHNKELIIKFAWDCGIGKTIKGRAKKKIGKRRVTKYLHTLRRVAKWLGKPFDEIAKEDMERLIADIEDDKYQYQGKKYAELTKLDFKKSLNKFYKWLGKADLVDFMDMTAKSRDVPAITRDELDEMINSTPEPCLKAALIVLFDGGARIEELLNLRIQDVTLKTYENQAGVYWINIQYSKTFSRTIPLPISWKHLDRWLREHPRKNDPEAQLFPYNYPGLLCKLKRLSLIALGKKVHPHMLRHSSATYWAPKMNRYQLCAKYGWAFSSDMPDRYIKRKGIIFDQIAQKGDGESQGSPIEAENALLKQQILKLREEQAKLRQALEKMTMPAINYERQHQEKPYQPMNYENGDIGDGDERPYYTATTEFRLST